jgi:hypothetical protein
LQVLPSFIQFGILLLMPLLREIYLNCFE